MSAISTSVEGKVLGLVGCGKIGNAVMRGFATCTNPPNKIIVSPRNAEKAAALKEAFPDLVEVGESNEYVVNNSDIIFIGLLPGVARSEIPSLPFKETHFVISMMAAMNIDEVVTLTRLSNLRVCRTVPLPSAARRSGPILLHPILKEAEDILNLVGTAVGCTTEAEMTPLVCVTGHISSFYQLMATTQQFACIEGVESDTARSFVAAFYSSLAQATECSKHSFSEMAEEAATPGGLNAQSMTYLKEKTNHFGDQIDSLTQVHKRLKGEPY